MAEGRKEGSSHQVLFWRENEGKGGKKGAWRDKEDGRSCSVATHTSHQVLFKDGRHMKLNRVKKEGNVLENTKKKERKLIKEKEGKWSIRKVRQIN